MQMLQPASPYYPVEDIIGRKLISGKVYYLVKWKDFTKEEATWERVTNLKYIKPLIQKYNAEVRIEKVTETVRENQKEHLSQYQTHKAALQPSGPSHRGKPIIGRIFTNLAENAQISISSSDGKSNLPLQVEYQPSMDKHSQSITIEERTTNRESRKLQSNHFDRNYEDRYFTFNQGRVNTSHDIHSNKWELAKTKNEDGSPKMFKPLGIKIVNDQPRPILSQSIDSVQEKKSSKCIELAKFNTKTNLISGQKSKRQPSIQNTTIDTLHPLNSDKKEERISQVTYSIDQSTCEGSPLRLKRMSMLHKVDGSGLQYFIEEMNGKLSIVSAKELIKFYALDYLQYVEKFILKRLA